MEKTWITDIILLRFLNHLGSPFEIKQKTKITETQKITKKHKVMPSSPPRLRFGWILASFFEIVWDSSWFLKLFQQENAAQRTFGKGWSWTTQGTFGKTKALGIFGQPSTHTHIHTSLFFLSQIPIARTCRKPARNSQKERQIVSGYSATCRTQKAIQSHRVPLPNSPSTKIWGRRWPPPWGSSIEFRRTHAAC